MKHGDKKKASKSAGKKSSKASKSSKVVQSAKAKTSPSKSTKASGARDNGVASRTRSSGDINFSNATVGSAFKHAVKKYSNAFRKLTD